MERENLLKYIKEIDILLFRKLPNDNNEFIKPSQSQMRIMEYILKHKEEEIYQRDLEEVLNLSRASVSGILQTMEKHKLIKRVIDEADTRTKRIILNNEAIRLFNKRKEDFRKLNEQMTEGITDEELKRFVETLDKMKRNLMK